MPTMILLPDGTSSADLLWLAVPSPQERHHVLDDDNGDTSYATCGVNNKQMTLEFANPTVAEEDINFDAGIIIRFITSGRTPGRGASGSDVDIKFQVPDGFEETLNYHNNVAYETEVGTSRNTKPPSAGGGAWSYQDLRDLEIRCTKNGTATVRLSYLALEVTYTEPLPNNATFFGANF
jgi:hypothetical protein